MNKVNAIQQAVSEYEGMIDEVNKKCQTLSEEYAQKINYHVEKKVNEDSKLTVKFGINLPSNHILFLKIKVEHSSGNNSMTLTPNEGQALYEILKELYE